MQRKFRLCALGLPALWLLVGTTPASAEETQAGATDVAVEQPAPADGDEVVLAPLQPAPSLQTLVDQRRDLLRERREARFEALTGHRYFMPPWLAAEKTAYEAHRDLMRQLHRERRDRMRAFHASLRSLYSPWSEAFHDRAELVHFERQMAQLDYEERMDELMPVYPFGFAPPLAYLPY